MGNVTLLCTKYLNLKIKLFKNKLLLLLWFNEKAVNKKRDHPNDDLQYESFQKENFKGLQTSLLNRMTVISLAARAAFSIPD